MVDSIIYIPSQGKIYYSINDGLNWLFKDWSYSSHDDITCLISLESNLIAGTYGGGIYLSSDYGDSWVIIDDSMPEDYTVSTLTSSGTYLLAGTAGAGIWQRPLSQIITDKNDEKEIIPSQYLLFQNYPNPFNPITKIKYMIPRRDASHASLQMVTLKVYDLLGREIATLVNEEKPAGEYEVEFNAANLPSGIYFYQLKAGNLRKQKDGNSSLNLRLNQRNKIF